MGWSDPAACRVWSNILTAHRSGGSALGLVRTTAGSSAHGYKPVDETPVWSIVCTYVAKAYRGKGYQHKLLAGAINYARDQGVRMLEAYPVDKPQRSHDDFMFFGSRSLYERAGFREVVRRSPTRLVMRRGLRPRRTG
jgi:GNAT superfamily N-acetyltransferase